MRRQRDSTAATFRAVAKMRPARRTAPPHERGDNDRDLVLNRAIGAVEFGDISIMLGAESNKSELGVRCQRNLRTRMSDWSPGSLAVSSFCWDWAACSWVFPDRVPRPPGYAGALRRVSSWLTCGVAPSRARADLTDR